MTVFANEEMIRLHSLVRRHCTGKAKDLAKKLGCSKRKVHYLIEQMRDEGLPIAWDGNRQSYYYEKEVSIDLSIKVGEEELRRIRGGIRNFQKPFYEKERDQTMNPPGL